MLAFDAYAPAQVASRVRAGGVTKVRLPLASSLALAVLAGAFIGIGAAFSTVAVAGSTLPFGLTRLIAGVTFSLGLILVVVAGAELFTGNNLVAIAWASRAVTTTEMMRSWLIVYVGNFIGAVVTALLVFWSGVWQAGGGAAGDQAVLMAAAKCELTWEAAFIRGVLCNALVCMAIWLAYAGRSVTDRILAIVWPISAFVALGFEHSVANMYIIPLGMLIDDGRTAGLGAQGFIGNLVPVTFGNIAGGTLLVAAIYWFVYLRPDTTTRAPS
jgi:formate/nitrite transporter